jgi:hypothetical protein
MSGESKGAQTGQPGLGWIVQCAVLGWADGLGSRHARTWPAANSAVTAPKNRAEMVSDGVQNPQNGAYGEFCF